ncbi:hypothetical protein [Trichlorobacter lovleyi]|uniref:Uncharacterized protein n=2 Tax=Trichlorobacter lovleyi TaxID=313985 RepID=B3E6B8_TRIL1|nr:hypothetical protein [Trichlorobacter lovleyi]ACD96265.1 hypothetical protein Glov_2551 [Trichlorobacter lovleyi SZ]
MKCPNCGYIRKPDDLCPEWQCPSCQMAYNKIAQRNIYPDAARETIRSNLIITSNNQPSILKAIVIAVLVCCFLYIGYSIAINPSFLNNLAISTQDTREQIENKKVELQAYEDALQKIEADIANARANVGICPITGQPNQFNLTQDPRPELQSKIEKLRQEIRHLENKS